jgi:hypothetical protein
MTDHQIVTFSSGRQAQVRRASPQAVRRIVELVALSQALPALAQAEQGEALKRVVQSVAPFVDMEIDTAELDAIHQGMAKLGLPTIAGPKTAWLMLCCLMTEADYDTLVRAVLPPEALAPEHSHDET